MGQGVFVVASVSVPQFVELNASAAFKLLVASSKDSVRDAAAEALWPRELINLSDLDCNDAPFESLPYNERALALLVASMIDADPSRATRLRVEPLYEFLAPRGRSRDTGHRRLFRMRGGADGPSVRRPLGSTRRWSRTAAFAVPSSAWATVMQICSWGTREREPYSDQYRWRVDARAATLGLSSRLSSRALATHMRPVLVSASGEEMSAIQFRPEALLANRRLDIDSAMILRISAGALAGSVISFYNQLPIVRGRRPRDATFSLEIGPSLDEPLIASLFKGNFEPRYSLDGILPNMRVPVRLLGGATIDELHLIARDVGVWHGGRLRGSFAYHPLASAAIAARSRAIVTEVA